MPASLHKGSKRPIRKSLARPVRPLRPKSPRAKPASDRPRLRSTKEGSLKGSDSLLVKKSDQPAKRERPKLNRTVGAKRVVGALRGAERTPGRSARPAVRSASSPLRKKFPPRTTGTRDRTSARSSLKLTKKTSNGTRIPISKNARIPLSKSARLPIKKIALPIKKISTPSEAATENKELRETVRLNKYISNAGITSRRKADELITQGAVTINGKVVTELGVQVKPYEDQVSVNGEVVSPRPRFVYLLLNKPKDTITTTSDEKDRTTVLDYVQTSERVYPVGRLDRNTTGVLLLTNDGELTNRLTHPSFEIEREYHATLDKRLEHVDARKIAEGGIDIGEGDVTGPAELLTMETPNEVMLKIREGKNREVRRIFETLGYEVEKLDRTSFAGLTHRGMSRGESRPLTNPEIHRLKAAAGMEL